MKWICWDFMALRAVNLLCSSTTTNASCSYRHIHYSLPWGEPDMILNYFCLASSLSSSSISPLSSWHLFFYLLLYCFLISHIFLLSAFSPLRFFLLDHLLYPYSFFAISRTFLFLPSTISLPPLLRNYLPPSFSSLPSPSLLFSTTTFLLLSPLYHVLPSSSPHHHLRPSSSPQPPSSFFLLSTISFPPLLLTTISFPPLLHNHLPPSFSSPASPSLLFFSPPYPSLFSSQRVTASRGQAFFHWEGTRVLVRGEIETWRQCL